MIRCYQGIDLVEVPAFREVALRHDRFLDEVFTAGERAYCLSRKDPFPHLAGRYAAKEACLKAVGIGLSGSGIDHSLQDVEVAGAPSGRPHLRVHGWVAAIARRRGVRQWSVSISHTPGWAVATVILIADVSDTPEGPRRRR
jgi:holo-[acyl-carrier protein] synthase